MLADLHPYILEARLVQVCLGSTDHLISFRSLLSCEVRPLDWSTIDFVMLSLSHLVAQNIQKDT